MGLVSEAGFTSVFDRSGFLGEDKDQSLGAVITPTIEFSLNTDLIRKEITPQILQDAGILVPNILSKEFNLEKLKTTQNLLTGNIANALSLILPKLNVPVSAYGNVEIGYDINYFFNTTINVPQLISSNGRIDAQLQAFANSSLYGEASSDFGSTLQLKSITLPYTFNEFDTSNLQVVFDSGDIFSVTREAPVDAEPIPTPALLPGLIGLSLNIIRKRKFRQA